jgi:hypothetical protein
MSSGRQAGGVPKSINPSHHHQRSTEGSLRWRHRPATPRTIRRPPRGPCAGGIDQPSLGRPHHRNRHRSRPRHSAAPHQRGLRRPWCFALPWCSAPATPRVPHVNRSPLTRGAQPVGLLDKAVKRTPRPPQSRGRRRNQRDGIESHHPQALRRPATQTR